MTALAAVRNAPAAEPHRWLVVRCSGRDLGIPLDRVREISDPLPATPVPGAGPEVHGVVGHRGRIVTAFDLGIALGGKDRVGPDHRLVMLERGGGLVALAVDVVAEVRHDERGAPAVSALDQAAPEADAGFVDVSGSAGDVVDLDRLLSHLLG